MIDLPLCVDCDGTLVKSDLLHEGLLLLVKQSWTSIFMIPFWSLKGKAHLKQQVAERVAIDARILPYNDLVIKVIRNARDQGRSTILVTAAARKYADAVANHLGLFDQVLATNDQINLGGAAKAECLELTFGKSFVYVGNSRSDLPVWAKSGGAIVVSSSAALAGEVAKVAPLLQTIAPPHPSVVTWLKAIRIHQWLKNLLVFVPLFAAHQVMDQSALVAACSAFAAFSFCSSAVYVINDLLDLASDRLHSRKRNRPFASGKLSIAQGLAIASLLLLLAAATSTQLPAVFAEVLLTYFVVTCLYSFWLKGQVVVDVMLLASLYTSRILAGAAATSIMPSFWLLAFSMFLFLSLALIKRYSEMQALQQENKLQAPGRGYLVSDEPVLLSLGSAAGYAAVLILALYINSPDVLVLYPNRWALWLILPPTLYWISRAWLKAHRGEIHDDPILFAVVDRQSWAVLVFVSCALWFAASRLGE